MVKVVFIYLMVFVCTITSQAQVTLDYYLDNSQYNKEVPKPSDILGFEVGEWHARHGQIVEYMYALAKASDRVSIKEYGRTYEKRPLLALTITSPENQAQIEDIKKAHVSLTNPSVSGDLNTATMPAVIYMGFSVHGNEPSGANAGLLAAYRLAASNEPEILEALKNTVILFDPSFNPDGLARFAHWANTNRGMQLVADRQSREHNEAWPYGRTNHYWFDLNRDWLPVQHVEMVGRIALFHEWKPNVLTDHHEMGTDATFFFQPGIQSRTNPITPKKNQELTAKIATYHAKAFDSRNALYYSEESFDDFYYGKGSTYPDVNGSIGILFEQASSRGHVQESINGDLAFSFTIKNQFEAVFSTLKAVHENSTEILNYQRDFYKDALAESRKSSTKGYLFGDSKDAYRGFALVEMLKHHKIEVQGITKDVTVNGKYFAAGTAFFVLTEQPQYRLIRAIFEKNTQFQDSLFYDVSAWTMPLAFNLPYEEIDTKEMRSLSFGDVQKPIGGVLKSAKMVGYVFETNDYFAHRAILQIQQKGIRVKVSQEPFSGVVNGSARKFPVGTILISFGGQDVSEELIHATIKTVAEKNLVTIYGLESGLTPSGVDFGSRTHEPVQKPTVLLLTGQGVNSNDAGELWHLLDTRMEIPTVLMDVDRVGSADLSKYTVILMAGGGYRELGKSGEEAIKDWVSKGGTLVAMTQAVRWLNSVGLASIKFEKSSGIDTSKSQAYSDYGNLTGAQVIGGSIFETKVDLTHPLAYGLNSDKMPVFRDHTLFMKPASNPFANPFMYTAKPLLSGYISKPNLARLGNTAAVTVFGKGRGKVIALLDNPNFRAFWYGPNKVLMNAIFFGNTISSGTVQR
ncbi:zinc carboxypeptidase [bacterium]|nr:MAG: zinc carboxypeptidase [bacterium]